MFYVFTTGFHTLILLNKVDGMYSLWLMYTSKLMPWTCFRVAIDCMQCKSWWIFDTSGHEETACTYRCVIRVHGIADQRHLISQQVLSSSLLYIRIARWLKPFNDQPFVRCNSRSIVSWSAWLHMEHEAMLSHQMKDITNFTMICTGYQWYTPR